MAYVVTDNCVDCKYTDCVLVCPVDCFYEIEKQLVIDPDECIDCSACEPECPVNAIFQEDDLPEDQLHWIDINAEKAQEVKDTVGEPITDQKDPLPTANEKRKMLGF